MFSDPVGTYAMLCVATDTPNPSASLTHATWKAVQSHVENRSDNLLPPFRNVSVLRFRFADYCMPYSLTTRCHNMDPTHPQKNEVFTHHTGSSTISLGGTDTSNPSASLTHVTWRRFKAIWGAIQTIYYCPSEGLLYFGSSWLTTLCHKLDLEPAKKQKEAFPEPARSFEMPFAADPLDL